LQPRAKVGEGQQRSRVHPWMSAAVMTPAGGGGGAWGTAALAGGGPGIAAL
jgi:hypothetical protein